MHCLATGLVLDVCGLSPEFCSRAKTIRLAYLNYQWFFNKSMQQHLRELITQLDVFTRGRMRPNMR